MSSSVASPQPDPRSGGVPHKAWTIVLASLGVFMTALDTLVVTTSLPALRIDLHSSLSNLEWTVNAYNLAFACFILTGAALGDRFGRRRMYVVGLSLFTAASAAAAASPDVGALVAARALQGIGAAIVFPLTLTLISEAFPVEKRGAAIGLWGGITGLGVAIGPVVGGAVVGGISWHWIFWLNVPIGIALIPLAARRLTESFGPRPQLDVAGLLLAGAGALGLTWGLVRASAVGWGSGEVLAALAAGATFIASFLAWERRTSNPMLPLALFRQRTFASANAVSVFMYAGLFGALFLMSQFFQTALGYSPLGAGLRLLPWSMPPMFIAPLAGALADRYGNRPFMALGLALQASGLAWVALIAAPGVSYAQIGVALVIAGTGTSFCFPTVANAIMGSVPLKDAGVASGANSALREFGGVLGVAVLASVFARHGVYTSPRTFIDGFTQALWVAVGFSVIGALAALLMPGRGRSQAATIVAQPALGGEMG
ncbi:MAG TPA: MFS transporter [Solirubrobacteraceae bacterium]|jgi:EmrB/QacA subfamily drug resistance transporter|nr:MFS transporter [Solirubrobacteraceae bacterium]